MARPTKQGIDYFPVDTEFDDDLQLLIAETGAEGIGILLTVWQAIYKDRGYYIVYDRKFPLKIKQKCFSNVGNILNVVENAINSGIFDKSMYANYKILTSRGIQKRYFAAARAKKQIEIVPEYTLIDVSSVENCINVVGNGILNNRNATKEKEKEKKEKNLLQNNNFAGHALQSPISDEHTYTTKQGKHLKNEQLSMFNDFWDTFGDKRGRADAADAWLNQKITKELYPRIIAGAKAYRTERAKILEHKSSPKMAQGWLSSRRWEDKISKLEEVPWMTPI